MSWPQRKRNLTALALGVAFFALYAVTAAPSIAALYDDSLEFQLVGPTFGIAHPTGYPFYTLLGWLWSRILFPLSNWAWRMNLFSALAAAATVALLFTLTLALVRTMGLVKTQARQRMTPGIIAAVAFGLGPIWWSQATIAEVYALHNLLVVSALLLAVLAAQSAWPSRHGVCIITLLALTVGLGIAHHRTIVLLGPGLLILLWGRGWLWRPSRLWLRWGAALIGPLLLYLYIPLRAATGVRDLNGSYVNTWQGFWHHVLALGYTGFFSENALTRRLTPSDWATLWLQQYGAIGLVLGLVGIGWFLWRGERRQIGVGLLVVLLVNIAFALAYRVGDPEVFMLPAWLSFAPWLGVAVAALQQIGDRQPRYVRALQALLLFLIVIGIDGRGAPVNRSQDWAIHDYAVALAKVDFPPGSQVIGLEGQITALRYMQAAEGLGRNAVGLVANEPAVRIAAVEQAMQTGKPVYLTQEVAGIADRYSFSGEGPLVRVWSRGTARVKAADHPLDIAMANGQLLLTGYDLLWLEEAGGTTLRVALYWQPLAKLDEVYKVSLRLQGANGAPLVDNTGAALTFDRYPLRQVAPTITWLPHEIVRDVYDLPLQQTERTAAHTLQIILYDATTIAEAGSTQISLLP